MIKTCNVKCYGEKYICDKCKEGEMLATGDNIMLTMPPKFKHKCNKCGEETYLLEKYPAIRFKIVE